MAARRVSRFFGQYTVYRPTAALNIKAVPPRWKPSTNNPMNLGVKPGAISWEVIPRLETGYNMRGSEYLFMNPTEIGEFAVCDLSVSPIEVTRQKFDPETRSSEVVAKLSVTQEDAGYRVALQRNDFHQDLVITDAELFVIKTLMFDSLPSLVGFPQTFEIGPSEVPDHMLVKQDPDWSGFQE